MTRTTETIRRTIRTIIRLEQTVSSGDFIVPDGVVLSGTLDNDIDTKVSQNNDRFQMTVQSPNEFRGAVVEGYLTGIDRSGKVTGRSEVTFNFQTIRLANGQIV